MFASWAYIHINIADAENEEDSGNDWLYKVISDIITNHNHTLQNLYSLIQDGPLNRLIPEEPSKIFPMEVTSSDAIVSTTSQYEYSGVFIPIIIVILFCRSHGTNRFFELLRSRYQPVSTSEGAFPTMYFDRLEEDLISTFIVGKPLIDSPSQLRTVFKFKAGVQK